MKMNIYERVIEIMIDNLGVDESDLNEETRLVEDLGVDSLDMVELAMELEEEFKVNLPDEEMESLKTVGDIVKCIENA